MTLDGLTIEQLRSVMGEVVDALPEREAVVLTALYWERLSLSEVAELVGMSKSNVWHLRNTAFKRIRRLVADT